MNWTMRINKIVAAQFPFVGRCAWQRQMTLKARILRSDKIKIAVSKLPEEQQDSYIVQLEKSVGIGLSVDEKGSLV